MLPIRIFGDPVLRKGSKKIVSFDDSLSGLIDEMIETMMAADGAGLAANQIGKDLMVAVIDVTGGEEKPVVLVNPVITAASKDMDEHEEGCLSFPDISLSLKRHQSVSVSAQDRDGKEFVINNATGMLARALQHEIDHLNGIMFIDHISPLQRALIRGKLKRLAKTGSVET